MTALVALALLLAQAGPTDVPVPDGHRPYGPPSRDEIIPGWETFVGDALPGTDCTSITQPLVQPLNPPHRAEAVGMLENDIFLKLGESEAARLLGIDRREDEPLAETLYRTFLEEMRRRKHRAEVERRDSWSLFDQKELEALTARFETGEHRSYEPYLVRAVAKFGDGGPPFMFGYWCGEDLQLQTVVFSYTIPPGVRVPAIVLLPRPPRRVLASVWVAW